jgi:hypothetical protein
MTRGKKSAQDELADDLRPNQSAPSEVTEATFFALTHFVPSLVFPTRGDFPDLTGRATVANTPSNPV